MNLPESDWKLFKQKIVIWQENFMARLEKKYIEILNSDKSASEKFWALEKRIYNDKKKSGVQVEMSRSCLFQNILLLIKDKVITIADLEDFSEELKSKVSDVLKTS